MRIPCVFSVDSYETVDKPLGTSGDIPFGISIIATILERQNHAVDLFVVCTGTNIEELIGTYIEKNQPKMLCLSAVSSQFYMMERVARCAKEIDPNIFIILGGHHASLASEDAILSPWLDAICIGEGDQAIVELASQIESNSTPPKGINNLWIKDKATGEIEKGMRTPFNEDLDGLPHINRKMWESWIVSPEEEISILVGRGCPYKCTYCSNHAMELLSPGKYTRYRSPADMIEEIEGVCLLYPGLRNVYLEVETIGASMWNALELFEALAEYNSQRPEKIKFRMNLAIHSSFVKREDKVREFFSYCQKANVVCLNVGLESGSERIRKLMRRPNYSNEQIINFSTMAREYGIILSLYVLIGLPDETPLDYLETVKVTRQIRPDAVLLAIFYPYIGTDLYETAVSRGLISADGLEPLGERKRAILDLPEFPRWRLRFEYIFFWYRVYKGVWPFPKIFARMARALIAPYPRIESVYRFVRNHSKLTALLRRKYAPVG